MILRVGLTGGIASGKSTVARTLAGLGCVTFDADAVVARLYRPGEAGYEALVRTYGRDILQPDAEIDRRKVADLAFATAEATRKLNALIHPLVQQEEERIVAAEAARFPERDRIVVVEASLLLEAGGKTRYDRMVTVESDPERRIDRAVTRGMSREDAQRRMTRQMTADDRRRQADYVIDNDGDLRALEMETLRVYEKLRADLEAKKARKK